MLIEKINCIFKKIIYITSKLTSEISVMKNTSESGTCMDDQSNTNQELISELAILRQNFEALKNVQKQTEFILRERKKELNCLHSISAILSNPDLSTDLAIHQIVQLLPAAWQFPEIIEALIQIEDQIFTTPNFKKSHLSLVQDIQSNNMSIGRIEIVYTDDPKVETGEVFLLEESELLFSISEIIGNFIEKNTKEKALIQSEDKYRKLIENINDAFYEITGTGVIAYISPAIEKMLGYTPKELIGRKIFDFVVESDRQILYERISSEQKLGSSYHEYRFINKTGNIHWLRKSTNEIVINEGYVSKIGTLTDITQQKLAELQLLKSDLLYRSILHASPDVITITDLEGKVLFSSPRALEMFGYENSEALINHSLLEFIDPADHPRAIDGIMHMIQDNIIDAAEYKALRSDGSTFDVEVKGEFIRDEEGNRLQMIFVTRDITQRKLTEKKLNETEALFRRMIETINDVVYEVSNDGTVVYVSPAIERILGYKPEEIIGKNFFTYMFHEDRPLLVNAFRELAEKDYSYLEYRYITKDGEIRWVRSSTSPILNNGVVTGGRGTLYDIHERKLAEESVKASEYRFRVLFESASVGMVILGTDNKILAVNQKFSEMTGYRVEDMSVISEWWVKAYPDEQYRNEVQQFWAKKLSDFNNNKTEILPSEAKVTCKDKSTKFLEIGIAITDMLNIVTFVDVSERRLNAIQLLEQKKYTESIIAAIPDLMFILSRDFIFLEVLPGKEKELTIPPEFFLNKNIREVLPKEISNGFSKAIIQITEGRNADPIEYKLPSDGKICDYEARFTPFGMDKVIVLVSNISWRKQTEEAMRKSEEKMRVVLDNTFHWEFWEGTDGKFIYHSPSCKRVTGYSGEELIGNKDLFLNMIHPEDKESYHQHHDDSVTLKKPGGHHFRIIRADGETRYIEHVCQPVFDENHVYIGIRGTNLDVTERKIAEDRVVQSEEKYRSLIDSSDAAIILIGNDETILFSNEIASKPFGLKPEDWVGRKIGQVLPNDQGQDMFVDVMEVINSNHGKVHELEVMRGNVKSWYRSSIQPVRNESGVPVSAILYINDITALKTGEEMLRQSEQKYKALFFDSPDGYLIIKDGQFIECNSASANLLRGSRSDILGKSPAEISPEYQLNGRRSDELAMEKIKIALENGPISFEWVHKRLDGTDFLALVNISVINYEGSQVLFITWQDITERRAAEDKLRKLSSAVEQSPISIVITNLDGNIEYANPKACQTTGYTLEELLGNNPRVLKSGDTTMDEYSVLWENIIQGKEWKGIFHNKRKNGELYWESSTIGPIMDSSGKITNYLAIKEDITERRQMQISLSRSEERLRQIAESSHTMIYESDANGLYTYVSPVSVRILGLEPEQVIQKVRFSDSLPEEYRELGLELYNRRTLVDQAVFPLNNQSMELVWVEVNAIPIFDENNEFMGYRGGLNDITKRKLAEDELKKFRTISDQSNYGNAIADLNGILIYSNAVFANMHGMEVDELIGKPLSVLHSGEQLVKVAEALGKLKATGGFMAEEIWRIRKDGNVFPSLMNAKMIFDDNNQPLFMSASAIDITDLKEAEDKIRKLNQAIEQSPVSIVITNLKGDIEYVSPAFYKTTGYTLEEVVGKNTSLLKSGKTSPVVYHDMWQTIEAGKPWQGEWINKKKNGELYWESVSITPIRDTEGKMINYLAVKQDISHRKQTEQEIRDLNASLEIRIAERTKELSSSNDHLIKEIEERKQIENELWAKTIELETFFNVSLDLICISDFSGNFIRMNKAWEGTMGYTEQEMIGKHYPQFIHPDDLMITYEAMNGLNEQNPVFNLTHRFRTKDDKYRLIEWSGSVSGNYIYAAARDITERKRAEEFENEMLRLSPKLTGVTISEIKDAINMALNRIGQFLSADRAYIFEFDESGDTFSNTYEWCGEGIISVRENLQHKPNKNAQQLIELLQGGGNVIIPSVKSLPESWKAERESMIAHQIQSLILIPMLIENDLIGFVGLDSIADKKIYNQAEINILKVWSSMLASLINNQRKEGLLELTRKNYETFFNTIDDFLFVMDVNGHIVHTNSTVNNRLGYSQEELAGQSVIMVRPPDRRDEALKVMSELLTGETQVCSIPLITKSGEQIPVETRVKSGFWNGQPIIFGVSKDISQIKLSEQKFASAFQANSAMMAISHYEDGRYIDVNNAFLETLGYSREEIIGCTNKELGLLIDSGIRDIILDSLNNHVQVRKMEVRMRTKDGEIKIGLLSADSIYIGENRCLLTVNIDITERKKAEDQLREARLEADRANLAKSEFLSRMSHELRTPMNSILGFAQLLEMGQLSAGQKKGISHIMRSGNHLLDLINEVLDIARIEAGRISLSLEPVKVSSIIPEMIDIIRPLANDKKVIVRVINMPDQQLYIKTDRQRLKQILLNLLNNAIKYNREGGQVFIKTEQILQKDEPQPSVRISITDSGFGISTDDLPKLFNPFERIGAERTQIEGTGLGLAVVKKLIDAMSGKLGVESTLGEGSTFWVEFPGCESQHDILEKSGKLNVLDANLPIKKGKILYVEDNASNIELVEEILSFQHEGIQLFTTIYGKSAVNLAITHKPDLILLDLNLPDIHGSDVLKLILAEEETRKIPVVIISADAMPQQLEKLLKAGAKYYLTKPLDVPELLRVIDRYIPD